jgi:transcriptional regulator with XRE-family HTH domain
LARRPRYAAPALALRSWRQLAGYSLTETSEVSGINPAIVSLLERGLVEPSDQHILKLARTYLGRITEAAESPPTDPSPAPEFARVTESTSPKPSKDSPST